MCTKFNVNLYKKNCQMYPEIIGANLTEKIGVNKVP